MDFYQELLRIDINDIGSSSRRLKYLFTALLGLLFMVVAYGWVIKPQLLDFEMAKAQEEHLKLRFLKQKALAINLDAFVAQKVEAQTTFASLLKKLPNQSEIPDLLVDITQLGLSRGLQFEQIKPESLTVNGFYAEQLLTIKAHGEYFQIAGFISDLGALPRIINVADFGLTRRTNSSQLSLNADIETYHYLPNREVEELAADE